MVIKRSERADFLGYNLFGTPVVRNREYVWKCLLSDTIACPPPPHQSHYECPCSPNSKGSIVIEEISSSKNALNLAPNCSKTNKLITPKHETSIWAIWILWTCFESNGRVLDTFKLVQFSDATFWPYQIQVLRFNLLFMFQILSWSSARLAVFTTPSLITKVNPSHHKWSPAGNKYRQPLF